MQRTLGAIIMAALVVCPLRGEELPAPPKTDRLILGATFVQRKGGGKVKALIEKGPAYAAGLRIGDRLLQVNGQSVAGLDPVEIARLVSQKNPVALQICEVSGKIKTLTVSKVPQSTLAGPQGRLTLTAPYDPLDELKPGDPVPDITAQYADGRQIKLSDWRGQPIMVVFWAAWNPPSTAELPALRALYLKYHGLGLECLGVSLDPDKLQLDKFLLDKKIPWPQHFDGKGLDGGVVMEWGVTALPVVALIGKDGKLIAENIHGQELEAAVKTALGLEASYGEGASSAGSAVRVVRRPRIVAPPGDANLSTPVEERVDLEALLRIQLPPNPTPEQVRKYLDQIFEVTRPQRTVRPLDPQVGMITRIGKENVPALIDSLPLRGMYQYYALEALQLLVGDESQTLILSRLERNPELISVVVKKGWEKEASATLKKGLHDCAQSEYVNLPDGWLAAIVRLRDPATHEDLKRYLATGRDALQAYDLIAPCFPEPELDEAVKTAWEQLYTMDPRFVFTRSFARIAAIHGQASALPILFGNLYDPQFGSLDIRDAILKITDARGSTSELHAWYEANKDKLRFNPVVRRYEVVEK